MTQIFANSKWDAGKACERCGKMRRGGRLSRLCKDCVSVEPDWPASVQRQLRGEESGCTDTGE